MPYASDGLPQRYYDVTQDRNAQRQLQQNVNEVMNALDENGSYNWDTFDDYKMVADYAQIDLLFLDQVEEAVEKWKEERK